MISYSKEGKIRTLIDDLVVITKQFNHIYYVGNFLIIDNNRIIIKHGFVWNGCSVARDNKDTDRDSCVHDALYCAKDVPLERKTKDKVFYELLKEDGFYASAFYYLGVRLFGGLYRGK
jgi:hypothetical protein